jgi:phosphoribosylformylglycinamidine synthase
MRTAIIVFPGSNCDRDVKIALDAAGHRSFFVWHQEASLPACDLVVLPGGFSYGDYLRSGAMAARAPIMAAVKAHVARGGRALGICNGFQILTEAGLLPGALMRNARLRFVCKSVALRVEQADSPFLRHYEAGETIHIPIAHHDGNYFASEETLREIEGNGQVALRYCDAAGEATQAANPNGSRANIAGVYNQARTVLGLMPHPERHSDPLTGGADGLRLFQSLLH